MRNTAAALLVALGAVAFAASVGSPRGASAAGSVDSVVQFIIGQRPTRLSHDMKVLSAGTVGSGSCSSVGITPTVDRFPGSAAVQLRASELTGVWLKAGDEIAASQGCEMLVTAQYTDATFTRPTVP